MWMNIFWVLPRLDSSKCRRHPQSVRGSPELPPCGSALNPPPHPTPADRGGPNYSEGEDMSFRSVNG